MQTFQQIRDGSQHKDKSYFSDQQVQFDKRLREKHGGDMQGLPLAAFKKQADLSNMGIREFCSPNGESWKDVNARAKDFLSNDIILKYLVSQEN